jgi:hypothetical protein
MYIVKEFNLIEIQVADVKHCIVCGKGAELKHNPELVACNACMKVVHSMGLPYSHDWIVDSIRWWDKVLTGEDGHWCPEWDYLPIDETCKEYECCGCT